MIWSIWSYVRFMLVNSSIRYICDTQHLNIICIISYFNIFHFFNHYFYCNIYAIILINLHRTAGPSHCLFFDIYNKFVVVATDKLRLFTVVISLHCILRQQYGWTLRLRDLQTHRGKCNLLIFILLLFCLSHRKHLQDITRWFLL